MGAGIESQATCQGPQGPATTASRHHLFQVLQRVGLGERLVPADAVDDDGKLVVDEAAE